MAVRLKMWSPSGCPGPADFVHALEKRHAHVRLAGGEERAVTVDVVVAPTTEGVLGRLVLVDIDGRRSERTVATANCGQASEALALVAALALRQSVAGDLRNGGIAEFDVRDRNGLVVSARVQRVCAASGKLGRRPVWRFAVGSGSNDSVAERARVDPSGPAGRGSIGNDFVNPAPFLDLRR